MRYISLLLGEEKSIKAAHLIPLAVPAHSSNDFIKSMGKRGWTCVHKPMVHNDLT